MWCDGDGGGGRWQCQGGWLLVIDKGNYLILTTLTAPMCLAWCQRARERERERERERDLKEDKEYSFGVEGRDKNIRTTKKRAMSKGNVEKKCVFSLKQTGR